MNPTKQNNGGSVLKWSIALTIFYVLSNLFFMDLGLHDETTFYLSRKDDLSLSVFLTRAEYGPLYATWYKLLSIVVRDNIALYFISWTLLVALSIQLMRIATKSVNSIIPIFVMLGPRILKVWPYVGLFAGALILLGFIFAKSRKTASSAIIVTAVSGFVVGLVRPEFLYAPAMLLAGYIVYALVRRQVDIKTLLICAAIAAMGLSISRHSDTGRGGVALEQHFNLRAAERGDLVNEVSWTSSYAREFFFQNPDKSIKHRLSDYIKANPVAVATHVVRNALDPRTILLALSCAAVSFFLYRSGLPFGALYISVMSLPPLISCTLIYPRDHYIVAILLTLIAGGSIAVAHLLSGRESLKRLASIKGLKVTIVAGLVLVVLAFPLARKTMRLPFKEMSVHGFAAVHPFASTAMELRQLEAQTSFKQPLVIFDPYGGFHHYLHQSWKWIPEFHVLSKEKFLAMIRERHASIFIINDYVLHYYKLSRYDLLQTFKESGYEYRPCSYMPCGVWVAPR